MVARLLEKSGFSLSGEKQPDDPVTIGSKHSSSEGPGVAPRVKQDLG